MRSANAKAYDFGPRNSAKIGISTPQISPPIGLMMPGGLTLGFAPNF